MKIKISYVCLECKTPGVILFDEADVARGSKEFECSGCGFKNGLTIKPSEPEVRDQHETDIALAEAYAITYCDARAASMTGKERDKVWLGVRAGYLQALEDFREHMRKSIKELTDHADRMRAEQDEYCGCKAAQGPIKRKFCELHR